MRGRKVYLKSSELHLLKPGEYTNADGIWYAVPPNSPDLLANLSKHQVVEHEDGTLSVSPSILVSNSSGSWHGYLERGIWRDC